MAHRNDQKDYNYLIEDSLIDGLEDSEELKIDNNSLIGDNSSSKSSSEYWKSDLKDESNSSNKKLKSDSKLLKSVSIINEAIQEKLKILNHIDLSDKENMKK